MIGGGLLSITVCSLLSRGLSGVDFALLALSGVDLEVLILGMPVFILLVTCFNPDLGGVTLIPYFLTSLGLPGVSDLGGVAALPGRPAVCPVAPFWPFTGVVLTGGFGGVLLGLAAVCGLTGVFLSGGLGGFTPGLFMA